MIKFGKVGEKSGVKIWIAKNTFCRDSQGQNRL